jgi:hypothetical protein
MGSQAKLANMGGPGDGYTLDWTDEIAEKPMLISDYAGADWQKEEGNITFYDYYFSVEASNWKPFNIEEALVDAKMSFNEQMDSQKSLHNFYCPTYDSLRHSYLCEAFVTNQISTLIVGNAGSGASAFLKEVLFKQVFDYTKALQTDHVTLTSHTDSVCFKENVEKLLEWREVKGVKALRPNLDNKLICFVEDLHMT